MNVRVGIGFDIHRLEVGRALVLGGVQIPHEKGLVGHSDGDALLHAVVDALLGASGLGDIGQHFPDDDDRISGIDSRVLLQQTASLIRDKGFSVVNIDSNVLAEEPRLSGYFPQMRAVIAETLGIGPDHVSVKARTMEGLGAIGAGEAVAAEVLALVRSPSGVI